jgi:hypothetical protein
MTQPAYGHMRASDADRERAADVLRAGFTEGRLSQEEYSDRVGRVQVSRTYGDLAGLVYDLPVGPLGSLSAPQLPYPAYPPVPLFPPGPGYPGPPPAAPKQRDSLAIMSLAVALAAATCPPASFAAVGLGIAALVRIRQTGQLGRNFAIAGIALGIVGTLIFIAFIIPMLASR